VDLCQVHARWAPQASLYKLLDFHSVRGVDPALAPPEMMTTDDPAALPDAAQPYAAPEMFREPAAAAYPADLWSLGAKLFQLVTGQLPITATSEGELRWREAVAGDMEARAPCVLDMLAEDARSHFDHNLVRVVETALEKRVAARFQTADEMHEAVYACLISRGEKVTHPHPPHTVPPPQPRGYTLPHFPQGEGGRSDGKAERSFVG
jgi:serine/threonine protein kinase